MTRRRAAVAAACFVLLAVAHPAPAAVPRHAEVIGRSVEGQPIRAIEVGDPNASHTVLVVGCIHGNEWAGMAIVNGLRWMSPPGGVRVWLVKGINPDGYLAGTRQNADGVDLNRNFPRGWRRQGRPGSTFYSGPRPASEPETRTAMRFVLRIHPEITIWYHQHQTAVFRSAGRLDVQRRYAHLVGLPLDRHPWLPGTATAWENHRLENSTAFVVELPAGSLSDRSARRHARAVLAIAAML